MSAKTPSQAFVYFETLTVENLKTFAGEQVLKLTGEDGKPSPWTLILGDNGIGKTTLLRCLAQMRPVLNQSEEASGGEGKPDIIEPALWAEDNETFERLARVRHNGLVRLSCVSIAGRPFKGNKGKVRKVSLSLSFERSGGKIQNPEREVVAAKDFIEPLVLAYGAGRHMGTANTETPEQDLVASLFSVASELLDAEEILVRMDHVALRELRDRKTKGRASRQLEKLKRVVAALLPQIDTPENIKIYGPKLPGATLGRTGVLLHTPYGDVPLMEVSLGYQTMMAWVVDLAWRLFVHYPDSNDPMSEPAIVLVDEIDLHLHPKWQREIRRDLTEHFPNVQFIATAHSPLMAQTALDANLAVLIQVDDRVEIVNDPVVISNWRLDQVVTSELFGLDSARPPEIERMMEERLALVRKRKPSAGDRARLKELDSALEGVSTAETEEDRRAMEVIREAAKILETSRARS